LIFEALELIFEVELVFFSVFRLGLAGNEEVAGVVWPEMVTTVASEFAGGLRVAGCLDVARAGGGLVFVWVYLVFLRLFYQNKLDYVLSCGSFCRWFVPKGLSRINQT
jgi:hypothetical protein